MVAAPLATYGVLASLEPAPAARVASALPPANGAASVPAASPAYSRIWQRILPWLVMAWIGGVLAFSVRLIGGWFGALRLRSGKNWPAPPEWQQTVNRL